MQAQAPASLVIFGLSNILSDLFDCAIEGHLALGKVVIDQPEAPGARDRTIAQRLDALQGIVARPVIESLDDFTPAPGERYILGPTTPARAGLAARLRDRFGLSFTTLVHPSAQVSRLARLGEGVFIGAGSVVGPGVTLGDHVFVNRGVTIGHDTRIGSFSRVQPGCHLGGLSRIGERVTLGIGSILVERLDIGDDVFVCAGSLVTADVPAGTRYFNRRGRGV